MRKLQIFFIVIIASLISLIILVLFGNFLSARLATLPGLRNWSLFNPRAPIVVTNRETVRVSDANDAIETANAIKSKLSLVVYYDGTGLNSHIVLAGGAVNWTADGYFVTTKSALAVPGKTYAVILSNGDIFPVKTAFPDSASNLMMLATDARNLSTAEPVANNDLRPAEKILLVLNAMAQNKNTFLESYLRSYPTDVAGFEFNSDKELRNLSIQPVGTLSPGQAAIDLNGKLAGIWDGTNIVSSDAISLFANDFFKNNQQILRPSFGFNFKQLSIAEARAVQLTPGGQVTALVTGGPAAVAGLQKGDIITSVNGKKLDDDTLLASLLISVVPGDQTTLEVMRNGATLPIIITSRLIQ
ncbi:MAG TPA: S1C family serine protease [Patescibacteria group bacterium]|jgi:S1-C subfamily serine protease|nr:S1C family serine protease [Patescibacteria group bacterium]